MDEQNNQDFQDIDNPAPTGSQGTQRPQRGRRGRAQRKPTQTEILAENVRSLTEMVRALVDTCRDANVVQYPRNCPKRPSPRRADLPVGESRTEQGAIKKPSLPGYPLGSSRAASDDWGLPRRPQKGYREHSREHDFCVRSPRKARSPSVHSPRMLCQQTCERRRTTIKTGWTSSSVARQWYRRLAPGSIGCFKQLADSFAAAFLSSKTRKLRASHLFGIKQGESETLEKYLERFDRAVVQVESCNN
ncbi:hypothetical protein TIFTF001_020289 [Ficus carica]|uniref:Retrotransposon gag domain-containing protein n=1 Tax=Ficus carica TaxID=3494 RepID=A0AA88AFS7_FICCA|nr:hypothetical protein TIFTF001_020289 [Ficus carica]